MSSKAQGFALALLACAVSYSARSQAEPAATAATSAKNDKARFAEAVRLFKAGQFDQALPQFEALASETGSPNARLYVGYCLNGLERYADAYPVFELTARGAGSDERYAETRAAALSELAGLKVRLGTLIVSPVELPAGLVVKVDGVVLPPAEFGLHRVLPPGDHHVEAQATERDPIARDVHLDGGDTKTVTLYFPKHETSPQAPASEGTARPGAGLRTAGFVAAGVGGAGLVAFVIGGIEAKSTYSGLESDCGHTPCTDSAHQREVDRGKSWQTVANVGLIVGGIGVAASATLLYFGFRDTQTNVAVTPVPGGALLGARTRF